MPLPGYRTTEEIAVIFDKHPKTIARWRQLRIGPPFVRVGKTVLYPDEGWKQYLKDLEVWPDRAA